MGELVGTLDAALLSATCWRGYVKLAIASAFRGEKMPGRINRPISEILAVAFMVVGASVGVFLAVEQSVVLRIIIIALGAIAGLGIGRQIGVVIERRQKTKRPPR